MNFFMKVDIKYFGCNNILQDFKFMKKHVKIARDVWWNNLHRYFINILCVSCLNFWDKAR